METKHGTRQRRFTAHSTGGSQTLCSVFRRDTPGLWRLYIPGYPFPTMQPQAQTQAGEKPGALTDDESMPTLS
ncbi:hypothetical protein LJC23_00270 [Desulfovibrio sp. OttesenSCG-928-I05]|nr:hypothetical protein [Desulfovibrio sp. OttesenSCG-928-I05]